MIRTVIALALLAGLGPLEAAAGELRESVYVEPGGTLEIDLGAGSVEVETHDENEVRVDAQASGWRGMKFELTSDGFDARLVGKSGGWSLFGGGRVRVHVRVPERYSLDVRTGGGSIEIDDLGGTATARTSGGSIELDGAEGPVELRTSGGPIRAENVEGDLSVRTSGGGIRIADVTGSVEARTSGGSIQVHDVGGPVMARTSGGSISVRFDDVPEGSLETSGGSIEAEFSEEAAFRLDAKTSGGRVRIEEELHLIGKIESGRIVGEINGGGPELRLHTSGGNVRVRVR
jgi:hypothetical protein